MFEATGDFEGLWRLALEVPIGSKWDPHYPCVYRMYDRDERLLYVGITGDLYVRMVQHARYKEWAEDVKRVHVEFYRFSGCAAVAEESAIATEKPAYNVAGKRSARACTREQIRKAEWDGELEEVTERMVNNGEDAREAVRRVGGIVAAGYLERNAAHP